MQSAKQANKEAQRLRLPSAYVAATWNATSLQLNTQFAVCARMLGKVKFVRRERQMQLALDF